MQTIVLTGGNGLLGHEVISLLSASDSFHIISLQHHLDETQSRSNVTYVQADLTDAAFIDKLPAQAFAVFHLAQSNHFRKFPEMAEDIFNINCKATQLLLNYALKAGVKKFIFTSTGGVYSGIQKSFKEDDARCFDVKTGYYANSKYIAELLIQNYNSLLDTIIFRPFFIYGKRQKKDMLIPRLISNVRAGNELKLDGQNGLHVNPIHVTDAANALVKSLQLNGSHIFNLGGPDTVSLREIGELIGARLNTAAHFNMNMDNIPKDIVGDISHLNATLYQPTIHFKDGLNELIDYAE